MSRLTCQRLRSAGRIRLVQGGRCWRSGTFDQGKLTLFRPSIFGWPFVPFLRGASCPVTWTGIAHGFPTLPVPQLRLFNDNIQTINQISFLPQGSRHHPFGHFGTPSGSFGIPPVWARAPCSPAEFQDGFLKFSFLESALEVRR